MSGLQYAHNARLVGNFMFLELLIFAELTQRDNVTQQACRTFATAMLKNHLRKSSLESSLFSCKEEREIIVLEIVDSHREIHL
jgi:hypothetical protein